MAETPKTSKNRSVSSADQAKPDNDENTGPVVLHLASTKGPRKPTTGNVQHTETQSCTINHTLHTDDLSIAQQQAPAPTTIIGATPSQRTSHHGAPPIKEPNSLETSTAIKSISVNLELMHVWGL
jgi:hypothetical protein